MIFLSNKKLRLIIITLLLLIFCFFLGMFKPKALSDSIAIPRSASNGGTYSTSGNAVYIDFPAIEFRSGQRFAGYRDGFVTFSIGISGRYEVHSIEVYGTDSRTSCNIGDNGGYNDNTTQYQLYSATCYIDFAAQPSSRLSGIIVHGFLHGGTAFATFSEYITYYSNDTNKEVIAAINSINNSSVQQQIALNNINNNINSVNNNTNDIKDSINDSSVDSSSASSSASTWNSKNATNGTITQLLTLPISLLNAIVSGISTSCSSFSLGSLFGTNISLPCINLSNLIGSGLFTTIDLLFSGFMILAISKKLIKIFNDFTNLKSNQIDELYGGGN